MSGPTATTRPTGGTPASMVRRLGVGPVVAVVAFVAATIPLSRLFDQPSFVDQITVENSRRFDISLEIRSEDDEGWLTLGTAQREGTSTFEEIIDQGEVWIFRFTAQARAGGELRLTRQELEGDQWQLRIPERVGDQLEARGAPPSP